MFQDAFARTGVPGACLDLAEDSSVPPHLRRISAATLEVMLPQVEDADMPFKLRGAYLSFLKHDNWETQVGRV
jgi:hypothetical protein